MILIRNKDHKIITDNLIILAGALDKTLGLLSKEENTSILFETRFGIHTFFMKRPIDVLICNKDLIVQAYTVNLKPNRVCLWNPKYDVVIELPSGTIKKNGVNIGDQLNIHNIGETW